MRRAERSLLAALALLVGTAGAPPAAAEVPAEKQAIILLRILAYDHALAERAGAAVRLAVVHGESAAALACAGRMRSALDRLVDRVVVPGKRFQVETMSAAEVSGQALARGGFSVLYMCSGGDAHVSAVVKAARLAQVLTFTDQLHYLARGLSIALSDDRARVGISVNLIAARAEGARLAGQFLRLSKVVAR
jgi:YfiR/HmsC-like